MKRVFELIALFLFFFVAFGVAADNNSGASFLSRENNTLAWYDFSGATAAGNDFLSSQLRRGINLSLLHCLREHRCSADSNCGCRDRHCSCGWSSYVADTRCARGAGANRVR
jgi:hypothetical protein